jgi:hypothetical protein
VEAEGITLLVHLVEIQEAEAVEQEEMEVLIHPRLALMEHPTGVAVVEVALLALLLVFQMAAMAVRAWSSSRLLTYLLPPSQAVLHPRYRLRYQDLRFTP